VVISTPSFYVGTYSCAIGTTISLSAPTTPLLRAAKDHDMDAIELLVYHDTNLELPNQNGITPLMAASGLGANSIDILGDYATSFADRNANNTIKALAADGADINGRDRQGRKALHGPTSWSWRDTVAELVESGTDLSAKDSSNLTAFDYAMGKCSGNTSRGVVGVVRRETAALIDGLLKQLPR